MLLADGVPEIWRLLGIRSHMALDQVHEVLQVAFGWEDAHLHGFTADDPFAPLQPIDGEIPEVQQWLPRRECEEPEDGPEVGCLLDELLGLGAGARSTNTTLVTAGFTGSSWFPAGPRTTKVGRRPELEAGNSPL